MFKQFGSDSFNNVINGGESQSEVDRLEYDLLTFIDLLAFKLAFGQTG